MNYLKNLEQDKLIKTQNVENNQIVPTKDSKNLELNVRTYTRPVLKVGSENPSGKLGGNACCGNC